MGQPAAAVRLGCSSPPTEGRPTTAERLIREVRADGQARGEGYALSAANFAEAILYNGMGRYAEAVEAARRELPYTHELSHAMRTLLELVEAASAPGERDRSPSRPSSNWPR